MFLADSWRWIELGRSFHQEETFHVKYTYVQFIFRKYLHVYIYIHIIYSIYIYKKILNISMHVCVLIYTKYTLDHLTFDSHYNTESLSIFKQRLKTHLFQHYFIIKKNIYLYLSLLPLLACIYLNNAWDLVLLALPLSVCLFKIYRFMYSPIVSRFG